MALRLKPGANNGSQNTSDYYWDGPQGNNDPAFQQWKQSQDWQNQISGMTGVGGKYNQTDDPSGNAVYDLNQRGIFAPSAPDYTSYANQYLGQNLPKGNDGSFNFHNLTNFLADGLPYMAPVMGAYAGAEMLGAGALGGEGAAAGSEGLSGGFGNEALIGDAGSDAAGAGGGGYLDDYGNPLNYSPSDGSGAGGGFGGGSANPYPDTSWPNDSAPGGPNGGQTPSTTGSGTNWTQILKDYGPLAKNLLPLLGGAAAGALGGSRPAGTVATTQDVPDWLKPYVMSNLNAGGNVLSGLNPNQQNPLLPAAQNEAAKTIRGDYLNPNTNPYFSQSVNDALGLAQSNYLGLYGGAAGGNVNNSGFQEGLARGLGATATNAYAQNYSNERQRQATAAFGAPQMVAQSSEAAFSPLKSYAGLFPNVQTTTQPYFNNQLGSIFSGAIGGAALGRAFG